MSDGYLDDLSGRNDLEQISSARKITFDSSGNLPLSICGVKRFENSTLLSPKLRPNLVNEADLY